MGAIESDTPHEIGLKAGHLWLHFVKGKYGRQSSPIISHVFLAYILKCRINGKTPLVLKLGHKSKCELYQLLKILSNTGALDYQLKEKL